MTAPQKLTPDHLHCTCDPQRFQFESTADIEALDEVIGQDRAVRAIRFGIDIEDPGYNIFVTGLPGTGKKTIVQDLIQGHAQNRPEPQDWCLVNNFEDEYRPLPIAVPHGRALQFSRRIEQFIEELQNRLPRALEDETTRERMTALGASYEKQKQALFAELDQAAAEKNLRILKTATEFQAVPVVDDQPLNQEAFEALPEETQKQFQADMQMVVEALQKVLREAQKVSSAQFKAVQAFMGQVALFEVKDRLDLIRDEYRGWRDIQRFLKAMQTDIVENVEVFLKKGGAPAPPPEEGPPADLWSRRYSVNVLVDRRNTEGAPVVFEPNPTFANLFGSIEKRAYMGAVMADFTMVQAGSMLQANGGYLILEIESLISNPPVWEALKRTIQNKQLFIEDMVGQSGFSIASVRPGPIALDLKVILLGAYGIFQMLQNVDMRFNKIFKVRADFDNEAPLSEDSILQYARLVARICMTSDLLPFSPGGVAAVVGYGQRLIAHQDKVSLRFGPIVDLIKEANFWAKQDEATLVGGNHVQKAFEEHRYRYSLYEQKTREQLIENTVLVDVEGAVVGQVNALSVYQMGDFSFGQPTRITAETFMGKPGLVNIEREVDLSGSTHDKGVLILSGYLGRVFAKQRPLSLAISIAFEQSYQGVDGDSASSTELYAILSSLADVPIHQGFAVTGSVNQKGQVQTIGGVNEKIEGFYDVCKAKGLNGSQGVLIPRANVKHLMLKKEIVTAVEENQFSIYAVETIEQGIELLTGLGAGTPDENGNYPEESLYGKVQKTLAAYHERALNARQFLI